MLAAALALTGCNGEGDAPAIADRGDDPRGASCLNRVVAPGMPTAREYMAPELSSTAV